MPFAIVIVMILFFPVFVYLLNHPSDAYCPAPIFLKRMEVYRALKGSIHTGTTTQEAINAFSAMCNMEVMCKSDMILVESLPFSQSDILNIHMARQFEFSGRQEFVQLHLDLDYPLSQIGNAPKGSKWYDTDSVDIQKVLHTCPPLLAVMDIKPSDVRVFIDWTWS